MVLDREALLIIEWVAATLGVINIGLLIFRSVWNFPFGIAMVALYIFVFFEERLYAEAALQIFFILAQLWGWWLWVKVGGEDDRVPVRWLDWLSRAVWITVTAAVSLNLGWVMHQFTDAVLPYADAGIAGASVAALFLDKFVGEGIDWAHFDTFAWRPTAKPGRPKGGDALGLRAAWHMLRERYG